MEQRMIPGLPVPPKLYAYDSATYRVLGYWLCVEANEHGGIWEWHDA